MEHLRLPRDPIQPCPVIPLFTKEPYDKKPFLGYLKRNPGAVFRDQNESAIIHEDEVCVHFQKWLFFGLLNEFLGDLYEEEQFIRRVDVGDEAYLDTVSLPTLTAQWCEESLDAINERDPTLSHFASCLDEVAAMLKIAPVIFPGHSSSLGLLLDVIASIAELFENLLAGYHESRGVGPAHRFQTAHDWLYLSYQHTSGPHSDNCDRMRAAGWCPNDINRAYRRFHSVEAWHYFRHLRLGQSSTYHATCDYLSCQVINVKRGRNVAEHMEASCSCGYFEIESDQLTSIYRAGQVPCLRMTFEKSVRGPSELFLRDLRVSMTSVTLDDAGHVPYTAISHVWSDGTGNTEANALPYCVLERLFESTRSWRDTKQAESQGQPVVLWIDTVCCPFDLGEGKRLALSRMKEIYLSAAFTVVFDKSLHTWEAREASALECAVRLFLSPWMRRLWTAQEAILASVHGHLVITYSRSSVSISYLIGQLMANKQGPQYSAFGGKLSLELVHIQKGVWYGLDELPPHDNMFALLSSMLRYRTTSVASDEALVVVTLLGFDARLVLGVSYEEAMCRIWERIPSIPGGLSKYAIFAQTPKLKTAGYRWASQSFTDSASRDLTTCYKVRGGLDTRGQLTPRGLVACYAGIIFRWVPGWSPMCIFGNDDKCEQHTDRIVFEMIDGTWGVLEPTYFVDPKGPTDVTSRKYSHQQLHKGKLVLVHPESAIGPTNENTLLVRIEEMTGATIFARPEHVVTFTKLRDDSCRLAKAGQACAFDLIAKLRTKSDGEGGMEASDIDWVGNQQATVHHHIRQTLEDSWSIRDFITAENKKNIHDDPNLDMDTVVAKFMKQVHYFGHLGKYDLEVLPKEQEWCIG